MKRDLPFPNRQRNSKRGTRSDEPTENNVEELARTLEIKNLVLNSKSFSIYLRSFK